MENNFGKICNFLVPTIVNVKLLLNFSAICILQLSQTQTTIIHHRVIDTIVNDDEDRDHPDKIQLWSFHVNNYQDFQDNPSSTLEIGKFVKYQIERR